MQRRQPLPRLGAGVVFRHYSLAPAERRRLFARIRRIARKKGLVLLSAGGPLPGADGVHGGAGRGGLRSASAHTLPELIAAQRHGAHLVFLSPVFPTRSHPGGRMLGRTCFGLIARHARIPVIALGGVDAAKGASLRRLGAYGWAGIDAWASDQKRKAVPI